MDDRTDEARRKREALLRAIARHRTMLAAYVNAIVGQPHVTDDVLGDLTVLMAEKGASFDVSKPLGPLLRGVARNLALQTIEKRSRGAACVDVSILDLVADELDELDESEEIAERKQALRACVDQLPAQRRQLLELRYFEGTSYEQIALRLRKSVDSLYAVFYRIHHVLAECVHRKLGTGGAA